MLNIKEKGTLSCIIVHCERIEEKINIITKEEFSSNPDVKDIVCFNIFQIGELAKNLSMEFIQKYDQVPWNKIKGMRDRIAHGYGTIEMDRVWLTAIEDIKPLREYCEEILRNN